jgi:broad specificity phosphatase PhoE
MWSMHLRGSACGRATSRAMALYLVRHGETEWNVQRRLQGHTDSPLTERGLLQVRAFGALLREELAGAEVEICMSPLARTRLTAALIAEALGIAAEHCCHSDLLRERYCGAWEGLTFEQIADQHGAEDSRRLYREWDARIGGDGETLAEMLVRAQQWLALPRARANTVIVTHGIMSRILRGAHLSLPPSAIAALPSHHQDRIFRLEHGRVADVLVPDAP